MTSWPRFAQYGLWRDNKILGVKLLLGRSNVIQGRVGHTGVWPPNPITKFCIRMSQPKRINSFMYSDFYMNLHENILWPVSLHPLLLGGALVGGWSCWMGKSPCAYDTKPLPSTCWFCCWCSCGPSLTDRPALCAICWFDWYSLRVDWLFFAIVVLTYMSP